MNGCVVGSIDGGDEGIFIGREDGRDDGEWMVAMMAEWMVVVAMKESVMVVSKVAFTYWLFCRLR